MSNAPVCSDQVEAIWPTRVGALDPVVDAVHERGHFDRELHYTGLRRFHALVGRLRGREQDAIGDVGRNLPQIDRMRLLDVDDEERDPIAVLRIKTIELGNSRAKRRSSVAAEDEDDRLLTIFGR